MRKTVLLLIMLMFVSTQAVMADVKVQNPNLTTQYRINSNGTKITSNNGTTIYRSNKPLTNAQILTIVARLK